MEIWLEDVVEQLSIARILRDGNTVSGKRLAMILVDNVVEFVIKVHGEDIIAGKSMKWAEWEGKKRHFEELVSLVLPRTTLSSFQQQILDYHALRNSLYHGTVPLSVDASKIDDYMSIAEDFLQKVFSVNLTGDEWKARVSQTESKLLPVTLPKKSMVSFAKTDDSMVKMETSSPVKDIEAVALTMQGFVTAYARAPLFDQLVKSLNYSKHPIARNILSGHILKLRRRRLVKQGEYSLTASGRKWLTSKFGLL